MWAANPASSSTREAPARHPSASTGALLLGFAGLLLLMAGLAADAALSARQVDVTSAALRTEARARDTLLDQLRADIFHSSTLIRDYLIEPDDTRAERQKAELQRLRARINASLRAYEERSPVTGKESVRKLSARVGSYWASMAPVLEWESGVRRSGGGRFLQDVVLPLGAELVEMTTEITVMNERDLDAAEERMRGIQAHFGRRVLIVSGCALLLGLLLGAGSIRRVRQLEREAGARLADVEEARRELQKLSARLLTAQEEERRNLARELHDEIGQALSAMLVELGRAESAPDTPARVDRLASTRRLAESAVGMVRNMALLLRPSMLDDLGLVAALNWQAREVARRSGLKVKMVTDEIAGDLPDAHRTCLYRVVQEALNNCVKHSQANHVRVVVHQNEDGLSVTVQDDGVGFDPGREKGMGLLGIKERVEQLGGWFSVESKPGDGAILSIRLPLPGSAAAPVKDGQ